MNALSSYVRVAFAVPTVALLLAGCAAEATSQEPAPAGSEDEATPSQSLSWSTFTIDAQTPEADLGTSTRGDAKVRGVLVITGSGTYKMGSCLLNEVFQGTSPERTHTVSCTTNADCATYATGFTGGSAYCTAPNNDTTNGKICYVRPGSQAAYCNGSPALGGAAVGAGTYYTAWQVAYTGVDMATFQNIPSPPYQIWNYASLWVTYGCINGCSGLNGEPTTPSVSAIRQFSYGTSAGETTSP